MTPGKIEFHRKRFEELIAEHPSNCKKDKNGRYLKPRIEYLFKGYLMAIDSIEIELPEKKYIVDGLPERTISYLDTVRCIQSKGIKVC